MKINEQKPNEKINFKQYNNFSKKLNKTISIIFYNTYNQNLRYKLYEQYVKIV